MRCICEEEGETKNSIQHELDVDLIKQMYDVDVLIGDLLCKSCWNRLMDLHEHKASVDRRISDNIAIDNDMCCLCTNVDNHNKRVIQTYVDLISQIHNLTVSTNDLLCGPCWNILRHLRARRDVSASYQGQQNRDMVLRGGRSRPANSGSGLSRTPPLNLPPPTPDGLPSSNQSRAVLALPFLSKGLNSSISDKMQEQPLRRIAIDSKRRQSFK